MYDVCNAPETPKRGSISTFFGLNIFFGASKAVISLLAYNCSMLVHSMHMKYAYCYAY